MTYSCHDRKLSKPEGYLFHVSFFIGFNDPYSVFAWYSTKISADIVDCACQDSRSRMRPSVNNVVSKQLAAYPSLNSQCNQRACLLYHSTRSYFMGHHAASSTVLPSAYPNRVCHSTDGDPHSDLIELLRRMPFLSSFVQAWDLH